MRFNTVIISFLIILFCVNNSFSDVRTLAIKPLDTLENVDRMAAKTASDLLFTKIGKHTENKQKD